MVKRSSRQPWRLDFGFFWQRFDGIIRYFENGFSNGPAEGLNTKARLATRQAYGFHTADAVLAMIDLRCSGLHIPLPRF